MPFRNPFTAASHHWLRAAAALCLMGSVFLPGHRASAQNTAIAYAYPVGKLTVDGDLSDWPKSLTKYPWGNTKTGRPPKAPPTLRPTTGWPTTPTTGRCTWP